MPDVYVVQHRHVAAFQDVIELGVNTRVQVLEVSLDPRDKDPCSLEFWDTDVEEEIEEVIMEGFFRGGLSPLL